MVIPFVGVFISRKITDMHGSSKHHTHYDSDICSGEEGDLKGLDLYISVLLCL